MNKLENIQYFAKGKRGIVYTADYDLDEKIIKVAVKLLNPKSARDTLENESNILKKVNKKGIGAKLILYDKKENKLIMEYINGVRFEQFIVDAEKEKIIDIVKKLIRQCRTLDKMHLQKEEMNHPHKHILVWKGKPVLIDFERAKYSEQSNNLNQLMQYLSNNRVSIKLKAKGIIVNRTNIIQTLKGKKELSIKKMYELAGLE